MRVAPAGHHLARQAALRRLLQQQGLSAALISNPHNVAYLTGFFGSAGAVVVSPDRVTLISDSRYAQELAQRAAELPGVEAVVAPASGSLPEVVAAELRGTELSAVGFEAHHLSVAAHGDLVGRLAGAGSSLELAPLGDGVETLRLVKDDWEVATLRDAGGRLSDVAKRILPNALAGITEDQLAAQIEVELRRVGFTRPAFDTIVASGPNGGRPHARAGDRSLQRGDLVVVDFGGVLDGYAVDMTRTLTIGAVGERERHCLEAVVAAQAAAFAATRPGVRADDIDAAARSSLAAVGLGEAFSHGLGHGLGLDVHERPRLAQRREGVTPDTLAAGMVFTLEPGVYFPGWGGVRIEDDVLTTADGAVWLTDAPRIL